RIARAELTPRFTDWGQERMLLQQVLLDGVSLEADALTRLAGWSARQPKAPLLVSRVDLAQVRLLVPGVELPPFGGRLLWDGGQLREAVLTTADRRATLNLQPLAGGWRAQLTAGRWTPPVGVNLEFDRLDVQGVARDQTLTITALNGELYGGRVAGSGQVSWARGWQAVFDLDIAGVNLATALPAFTRALRAEGTLAAKARVQLAADRLGLLTASPTVRATFVAREGTLGNVDLVRAINAAARSAVTGGETRFNGFSGYLELAGGRYRYQQLRLNLGMLSAAGSAVIEADGRLAGDVVTELRSRSATLRVPLTVEGTLEAPTLRGRGTPRAGPAPAAAPAETQP
ncbi:MAG: AsmA-like C-terminal region-containing protein, partial [Burkholderiales bacterium]